MKSRMPAAVMGFLLIVFLAIGLGALMGCRTTNGERRFTEADAERLGGLAASLYLIERPNLTESQRSAVLLGYTALGASLDLFSESPSNDWSRILSEVLAEKIPDPALRQTVIYAAGAVLSEVRLRVDIDNTDAAVVLEYLRAACRGVDTAVATIEEQSYILRLCPEYLLASRGQVDSSSNFVAPSAVSSRDFNLAYDPG